MRELVTIDLFEASARLTINRPDVGNSVDSATADALLDAVVRVAEGEAVRVVVLTGAGRMFCAGGDVRAFAAAAGSDRQDYCTAACRNQPRGADGQAAGDDDQRAGRRRRARAGVARGYRHRCALGALHFGLHRHWPQPRWRHELAVAARRRAAASAGNDPCQPSRHCRRSVDDGHNHPNG